MNRDAAVFEVCQRGEPDRVTIAAGRFRVKVMQNAETVLACEIEPRCRHGVHAQRVKPFMTPAAAATFGPDLTADDPTGSAATSVSPALRF